ncbi:NAD(P)-dependent oxidoreductase [uncultured Paludibaculum sp.]|uniref:NAD-dependent epimerase/dehydratase family protein n=1 Tax=uncultured Paludibaculum sp. TaxID=1765020 RepID=UPI002AAA6370|nr:NAD(P)-dependent oxidoreductase [uncultured Paludibaculum sp.]
MTNIQTDDQLEELLSRPLPGDVEAVRALTGDLVILGVGGKMGPTLALRARRAIEQAGLRKRVIGVSRFGEGGLKQRLEAAGIETVSADLLDRAAVSGLPDAPDVVFMAGRKFGTEGSAHLTWAMNALVPALVAERYKNSRIAVFSSGNVYAHRSLVQGGSDESTPPAPVGEYAQSVLARERVFEYASQRYGTRIVLLRLNYAVELRYGVLADIGGKVFRGEPVELGVSAVNVIWQGDANSVALQSLALASSPPAFLNIAGPETIAVRRIAERFGAMFGKQVVFAGTESGTALLNDAAQCHRLFGYPSVSFEQCLQWTAEWIQQGGASLDKPTHFEIPDGRY